MMIMIIISRKLSGMEQRRNLPRCAATLPFHENLRPEVILLFGTVTIGAPHLATSHASLTYRAFFPTGFTVYNLGYSRTNVALLANERSST
jgi:hypothetical protein